MYCKYIISVNYIKIEWFLYNIFRDFIVCYCFREERNLRYYKKKICF